MPAGTAWRRAAEVLDRSRRGFFRFDSRRRLQEPRLASPVRNRGRLVFRSVLHLAARTRVEGPVFSSLRLAQRRTRIGERLAQVVHEHQLRSADADDVARLEKPIALQKALAHRRAVAAVQVADRPAAIGHEQFGVGPATALVLQNDLVRRGPADRHRVSGHQPKDVAPLRAFPNDQIGKFVDHGSG